MKRYGVGIYLCIAGLVLFGCGPDGSECEDTNDSAAFSKPQYQWESADQTKLTLWSRGEEADRAYMKKGIERYRELTGGEIEIIRISNDEMSGKLSEAFSGEGEKPDLILSYGGTNIDVCDPEDNFYDFTDAEWVDDLTGTSINQTIYNGKVVGLPHWEASVSGILYNKQIFRNLGLEVPRNQTEFMAVCDTLKKNGIIPVYMPASLYSMILYQFPLDTLVEDPDILKGLNDGSLHYEDLPGMKTTVEWFRAMAEEGYFGTDYRSVGWDGMNDAMASRDYAMMYCWDTWLYTDFTGDPSEIGLMPAFMGIPEEGTFEGPNLALLIVNKNSPRLKEALNFITFMADPYNYNVAFEGIYTAPVFKNQVASISTPQYIENERMIERCYRDSTAWLRIRGFSQMDAVCIFEYMSGQGTAEECLQRMDELREKRIFP